MQTRTGTPTVGPPPSTLSHRADHPRAGDAEAYRRTTQILVEYGADINRPATGDGGQTPLGDAVRVRNEAVAEVLRSLGAVEIPYSN